MQKFPLRNRCNPTNNKAFGSDTHTRKRRDCGSLFELPPPLQRLQRICQPMPSGAAIGKCQYSMKKPVTEESRVCNRIFTKEAENAATWNEILCISTGCHQSKSLPSAVSSSPLVVMVDSNTAQAEGPETVQRTTSAGGILEVPCNVTASSSSNPSNNTNNNNNTDANGNRNKDDDDDNNRRSRRQQHQRITQPEAAVMPAAASTREFMTSEGVRLGDQINFLLFDPYRTLKFLITELKSRLRTVIPDDINVQKILVEIQQTMKRIRIPTASETLLQQPVAPRRTITTLTEGPEMAAATTTSSSITVGCILPKERCHVMENDPLINHAKKVNSSCQTIALQLENVNACQKCEHEVNKGTAGCNQSRINEPNNADDGLTTDKNVNGVYHQQQRSGDHRKDTEVSEVPERFSCKSLADAIQNCKIKNNLFSHDTQRIITQLEAELLNFQQELQRTSSCSLSVPHAMPPGKRSTQGNLKVHGKRLLEKNPEQDDNDNDGDQNEKEETFLDFIADKLPFESLKHWNRLDSSTQATAPFTISKESQTNIKIPTQMFCHLEKEKLLLLQQFRTSEMQTIQGDLNELHAFIKHQLDGIYHTITRGNLNHKYCSNNRRVSADKNKQKTPQKILPTFQQPERTQPEELPSLSSLTASTSSTSSVLSSNHHRPGGGTTSILRRHYKKSSPIPADSGYANNTKSMMKQKSSSSLILSAAVDARKSPNISDVDKADKALGGKKSKEPHQQLYGQKHLFVNCRGRCRFADTPFCSDGEKNHFSAVDCGCPLPLRHLDGKVQRVMTTKATRTSTTKSDINSTKETPSSAAVMTDHQCHQQPALTTGTAQDRIQLISSSLPAAAAPGMAAPSYITKRTTDETSMSPDTVTNAAVKTIIKSAYAATVTSSGVATTTAAASAAGHTNGIRMPSYKAHNSWQRVNLKNPTGCQLKKQICGSDGYECRINKNNNNNSDNRSNYPEIHDCQKYRASSINPFCGLCSAAKMHEVGADNGATAFAATSHGTVEDDYKGCRDDIGAGGDGPINWMEEIQSAAIREDFRCHPEKRHQHQRRQRKQAALLHCCAAKSAFQRDLEEFKESLDSRTE